MVVTLLFLFFASQDQILFHHIHLLQAPDSKKASEIFRLGLPSCLQSLVFTGISMTIARLVAGYGDAAVAVQKVGAQIESISWMTSDGFASAVNSFIAQNHGAGKRRQNPCRISVRSENRTSVGSFLHHTFGMLSDSDF